jgi:hypothetical protein
MPKFWRSVEEVEPPKGDGDWGPWVLAQSFALDVFGDPVAPYTVRFCRKVGEWVDGSDGSPNFPGTHWAHIPSLDAEVVE